MAWLTRLMISQLAKQLPKKDLSAVVQKLASKLSQTEQRKIALAVRPIKRVETNADMLTNAIQTVANENDGVLTAEQLVRILENHHNFNFTVFYKVEGKSGKRRQVL